VIEDESDVCHNGPRGKEVLAKKAKEAQGAAMDDLSRFCCQNAACTAYGKRGGGNLTGCMH
jgi:hypothetical protein